VVPELDCCPLVGRGEWHLPLPPPRTVYMIGSCGGARPRFVVFRCPPPWQNQNEGEGLVRADTSSCHRLY
ncbi:hypothetical protein A2U01_0097796, partial [Trifolium medium]|nr:hypothetical protein [Trifolium medium]